MESTGIKKQQCRPSYQLYKRLAMNAPMLPGVSLN
ncbi:hypothetical protein FOYG_10531 [Fusarium oxysporum NRRL 32931]|uniref:Uncharacterized protein n=1 Tax=Fusarium oxysporum NRRL 32931 TaxID=660029 RepID=W9HXX1_FUSOX|nr:hypothetical protein FOYG_10531 [Fusarium oxysporum NRRL 32931]